MCICTCVCLRAPATRVCLCLVCVCVFTRWYGWMGCVRILLVIHPHHCASVCGGGLHVYKGLCIDVFKWSFLYSTIGMYLCIFPGWCLSRWVWLFMSEFVKLHGWVCHCAWKHEPRVYICVWIYLYCVIVYVDCSCLCVYVLRVFLFFS